MDFFKHISEDPDQNQVDLKNDNIKNKCAKLNKIG